MPEFHHLNVNFNGGELSPLMVGRVDFEGYRSGCVQMENFMVRPYGGAFKAPGTQFLGEVKDSSTKVRLVPLKVSRDENYIFEVGVGYIRFWREDSPAKLRLRAAYSVPAWSAGGSYVRGEVVSTAGTTYVCIEDHFYASGVFAGVADYFYALTSETYWDHATEADISAIVMEWPNDYTEDELFALQWKQIGRSVIITQANHPPLIIESVSTSSTNPFIFGASWGTAEPEYSFMVGNASFTFPPLTEHELSSTGPTLTITPITTGSNLTAWVTATVYALSTTTNPVQRISREIVYTCIQAHTSNAAKEPLVGANWTDYWRPAKATDGGGYAITDSSSVITSALAAGDVIILDLTATSVSLALSSTGVLTPSPPRFLQGSFTFSTEWASGAAPIASIYLYESVDGGTTWDKINEWLNASATSGSILFEGTAPASGAWYRIGANVTTSSANAKAKIEPNNAVVKIPMKILAGSGNFIPVLAGGGMVPNDCLSIPATTFYESSFSSANGYPLAVGIHNQRLWFGGTEREPNRVRASSADDLFNFATGSEDSDAFDLTLNSSESNAVRWIAGYRQGVVIGTEGEEWTIQGGGDGSEVLKPTNIQAIQRNRSGSKGLAAIQTRDALLWVSLTGRKVFEFSYVFSTDDYKSPDMTLRAEHITESGIVDIAFQSEPDPVLWCVLDNGNMIGFSYNRDNQIAAWFKRTTDGLFESVAAVRATGDADRVWCVVKRTINGATKRYVERFYPTAQEFDFSDPADFCYLDCAKVLDTSMNSLYDDVDREISSMTYLTGKTVKVWSDGADMESHTAGSTITLDRQAAKIVVGLPYTATLQPMPIEQVLQDGTAQGRRFNAQRLHLLLHSSLGGSISDNPDSVGDSIGYPATSYAGLTAPAPLVFTFTNPAVGDILIMVNTDEISITFNTSDPGDQYFIDTTSLATPAQWASAFVDAINAGANNTGALNDPDVCDNLTAVLDGNSCIITSAAVGPNAELSVVLDDIAPFAPLIDVGDTTSTGGGSGASPEPNPGFTGRLDEHIQPEWKDAMELTFTHSDPTPFNLLGFIMKAEVSGQ
jgi:hypothetical protein